VLLVLGAMVVAGSAALSRSGSGLAQPRAASAACKNVGWIAELKRGAPVAYLRLAGASSSCTCPGKRCTRVARNQNLFENETMFSGGGKITFKSVVKGAPNLTCILAKTSIDVIYPAGIPTGPGERAILKVNFGATSCQVEQGKSQKTKTSAIFIVHNTKLTVQPLHVDPVFGIKAVGNGSLIQVKKGSVTVAGTAGQSATTVGVNQQVVVPANGTPAGGVTPLKLDPALRPGLCALTPDLRLTDVKTASGAHPGGNPLGLAPDPSGNIWFTDNVTPAVGFFNPTSGQITYPQDAGLNPGSKPTFIVADPTGTIWFTDAGTTPAIGMIDPKTETIHEYALPAGSAPWNPMYDPVHQLLWFTDRRTPTGAIGVLDPKTKAITEYSKGLNPGSHPEGLAVDPRGNVWFTDDNGAGSAIGMLDGTTYAIHEYSTGLVDKSLPRGIMIDPKGNVWFADERTGDGLIGTISTTDPKHAIAEYAVPSNGGNPGSTPEGLAWYGGHVWFTDDGATKAIGRLDPTTGAIAESSKELEPDSHPIGILVTKNVLWFTDRFQNAPKIGRLKAKPSC
jgi:streptogramin lyase